MGKSKTVYVCSDCGTQSPKWQGQCPGCGAWNTLVETVVEPARAGGRFESLSVTSTVQTLADVEAVEAPRAPTGIDELDRVLGGGLVRGAVVLIGGDPGIGKSTLLLQALATIGSSRKVL
ncbi:TPA: ATPase domain-containing protein, partial [Vibrio cholerae O1]